MSKLTKSAAYDTALKMADKAINPKLQILKDERKTIITVAAIRSTPSRILKLYVEDTELSNYIKTRSSFRYEFDGMHEDYDVHCIDRDIPRTHNGSEYISVNKTEYERLIEIKKELSILYSERSSLIRKIESTLLSLGTLKRIKAEFPEAYSEIDRKYIDKPTQTTVCLPIEDLKAELLKYK